MRHCARYGLSVSIKFERDFKAAQYYSLIFLPEEMDAQKG